MYSENTQKFLWLSLPGIYESKKTCTGRSLPKKRHWNVYFIILRFAAKQLCGSIQEKVPYRNDTQSTMFSVFMSIS